MLFVISETTNLSHEDSLPTMRLFCMQIVAHLTTVCFHSLCTERHALSLNSKFSTSSHRGILVLFVFLTVYENPSLLIDHVIVCRGVRHLAVYALWAWRPVPLPQGLWSRITRSVLAVPAKDTHQRLVLVLSADAAWMEHVKHMWRFLYNCFAQGPWCQPWAVLQRKH